jgi:hypothetical protein
VSMLSSAMVVAEMIPNQIRRSLNQ